ncbi:MAG TPA: glutathione S-transferase [Geminicoccaceae bacterium]|nr:glutathione S-transferase [Geminicoccaceae bacterium]
MLRVWGRSNSINVQKVMWTVGELALPHQRIDIGGAFGGLDTPEYGKLNPNRRVPTVEDGEVVVWESNACVRYLAARYGAGSLWPEDPAKRVLADMWMDWQQTTLLPEMTVVFWGLIRTPEDQRDNAAIEAAAERLGRLWPILDDHLASRRFVAGDAFTIGDIPVGAACYRYYGLPIARPRLPNVEAWYGRLQERAPFREHVMVPIT